MSKLIQPLGEGVVPAKNNAGQLNEEKCELLGKGDFVELNSKIMMQVLVALRGLSNLMEQRIRGSVVEVPCENQNEVEAYKAMVEKDAWSGCKKVKNTISKLQNGAWKKPKRTFNTKR